MQMTLAAEIAEQALITEPTVGVAKARRRHQWLARRPCSAGRSRSGISNTCAQHDASFRSCT